ncbi:MAG: SURF1 family protein, partial [Proteobacteria bacterium]|nr:SURF1 family protein [Pseudomonadota bacterium]
PYVLRLAPDAVGGFVREWPGPSRTMIQRHQAYAVQWFGMAAVFVLVVISFMWRQRKDFKQGKIRK